MPGPDNSNPARSKQPLPPGVYNVRSDVPSCERFDYLVIQADKPAVLCRYIDDEGLAAVTTEGGFTRLRVNTIGPVTDIDALLRESGTVHEPSIYIVLRDAGMLDKWIIWERWRNDAGRRAICPKCNTAFIRDRAQARRCPQCRSIGKRTGKKKWEPRPCADCRKPFEPRSWNHKRCDPCRQTRRDAAAGRSFR